MRNAFQLFNSLALACLFFSACSTSSTDALKKNFRNPPDDARPGVYWYFMDGNLSREGMTADLESMKEAGIGHVIFLEVNVGVPRGSVSFLSDEWQELYVHAVREAERLGIEITLGSGPGWAGSGGPWVKPEQSMQHLVASAAELSGPLKYNGPLPKPPPRKPYFGERALTEDLKKLWEEYYEDVAVLAFPTPEVVHTIADIDEKALYYRAPYTSRKGVKPYLPAPASYQMVPKAAIDQDNIIDLTNLLQPDGTLNWEVPEGDWTVMRFGKRNNGAVTRPAPEPGLGFEADKFDTTAFNAHFDAYIGKLIQKTGRRQHGISAGWNMIHIDSWEMGAQNWSRNFRQEFKKRRGYDLYPFMPVYAGRIVGSLEQSERFLWDLRQTSMELILENHAGHFKTLGQRHGFALSIEPYDMNPASDFDLGAVADVPMCEFWSTGPRNFNSAFSCIEATSIAHVLGRPVVAAEAFTSHPPAWTRYPGNMKNQGDWAFAMGINKFVYHTFAHQPFDDKLRPGMTMGPYGVHWDRGQTWWPMASSYHRYVARCQYLLRKGRTVADILYLTPEGAPHVFRPPHSAMDGNHAFMPDKRGYNFDGCSPLVLMEKAEVRDHQIVFPGGAHYRLLVLSDFKTMTPELIEKIESLVKDGAHVLGSPPIKSPSLVGYPHCDEKVRSTAEMVWGGTDMPKENTERNYGNGRIYWGGVYSTMDSAGLYPPYNVAASILSSMDLEEDFTASGSVRYTHRTTANRDIYFISNRTDRVVKERCSFRAEGIPELWDPITGDTRLLKEFESQGGRTTIPIQLNKYQSFFVVFQKDAEIGMPQLSEGTNFPEINVKSAIEGAWEVSFDPKWGGPDQVKFNKLTDWTKRPEEGIRYYSGTATYFKAFDLPGSIKAKGNKVIYLNFNEINGMARVKLNGEDLGVVWTAPWQVDITDAVKTIDNKLEIQVANLWVNRLIGDANKPDDRMKKGRWPDWLLEGKPRISSRYTFTTNNFYSKDMPLQPSGLAGPVELISVLETER